MDLEPEEQVLLRALASNGSATYVGLTKAMGLPLTPASPTMVRETVSRPLRLGFVRKAGVLGGRYKITPEGLAWIDEHANPAGNGGDGGAQGDRSPARHEKTERPPCPPLPPRRRWLLIGGVGAGGMIALVALVAASPAPMELLAGAGIIALVCASIIALSFLPRDLGLRVVFGGSYAALALLVVVVIALTAGGEFPPTIAVLLIPVVALVITALVMIRTRLRRRAVLSALGEDAGFGQVDMPREKSPLIAYIFWLVPPLGVLGLHRYYLGKYLSGFLYTFTLSLFMVGWIVDALLIPRLTRTTNQGVWEAWFANAQWPATAAVGTARDVKLTTVQAGDYPGAIATKQVLNFRVELIDENGDIDRLVPVELVGNAITGSLRDGDSVSVRGKLSGEGILRALAVDNDTTSSRLVVRF